MSRHNYVQVGVKKINNEHVSTSCQQAKKETPVARLHTATCIDKYDLPYHSSGYRSPHPSVYSLSYSDPYDTSLNAEGSNIRSKVG